MKKNLNILIQYLLSIIFIVSAVTKLLSIDEFQVFIYSLKIVNLNMSMLFTRTIIAVEFCIGLALFLRIYTKAISLISITLLIVFTLFAAYLELSGSSEDCHCFGSFLQISNTATIIKNLVIISLLLVILKKQNDNGFKLRRIILIGTLISGYGLTMIVHPPDIIMSDELSSDKYYNKITFEKFIADNSLQKEKKIICFFSPECKYCKLAAKKMSVLAAKANNSDKILYVFWTSTKKPADFFKETKSTTFNNTKLNVIEFLKLTNGSLPLIVMYNNKKIEKAYRYNEIDEKTVIEFLSKN